MKKVDTNSNLLKGEKNGKYLIKLPKSEFMFWHPKELVHLSGKKNYLMTISHQTEDDTATTEDQDPDRCSRKHH